jgi:hypothetical protein
VISQASPLPPAIPSGLIISRVPEAVVMWIISCDRAPATSAKIPGGTRPRPRTPEAG